MQRSFSTSSADYQHYHKFSEITNRYIPTDANLQKHKQHYSSDMDFHTNTNLQRTASASSCTSTTSTNSANYRILPVRYSSVDRVMHKPPTVTANEHGINVRIHFKYPHHHHRHRRQYEEIEERQYREQHEHKHEKHLTKQHEQYSSCPTLNKTQQDSNILLKNPKRPSNINYIETRSVIRGYSTDQLNNTNNHSSTLIIRHDSLPQMLRKTPSQLFHTQIKHFPLDTHSKFQPIITRVIREEEE